MFREFIEELKHNQNINYKNNLENRVDIDYVLERLEDIQEIKNSDPVDYILGIFNELDNKYSRYELIENECYNLLDEVKKEAQQEIKKDNGYHNVKLNALKKELENIENIIERLED